MAALGTPGKAMRELVLFLLAQLGFPKASRCVYLSGKEKGRAAAPASPSSVVPGISEENPAVCLF